MKKYVSSLKNPVNVFTTDNPKEECKVKYMNFCNLMKDLKRDPAKIAVVNYSLKGDWIRTVRKPDDILFGKGWVPVKEYPGWPRGNGIITNDPEITLVNCNLNAIYFHDEDSLVVGTAVCNNLTVMQHEIAKDIITAFSNYDISANDIYVEYPPHLSTDLIRHFVENGIKNIKPMSMRNSTSYDFWLYWTDNQTKKDA